MVFAGLVYHVEKLDRLVVVLDFEQILGSLCFEFVAVGLFPCRLALIYIIWALPPFLTF